MEGEIIKTIRKSDVGSGFEILFCDNTRVHSNAPTEEVAASQNSRFCPKPCPVD